MDNQDKLRDNADQSGSMPEEDVIELTDTVNVAAGDEDGALLEDGDDFIELTELAEVPSDDRSVVAAPTEGEVEQALRSVIKELYAEKIERLLFEVVEETVTREIDKIKSLLLDGGADRKS